MSETIRDKLLDRALHAEEDAKYWRERCRRHEAHYARLEVAGAAVRAAVEQFMVVVQAARPQGTEPRA